MALTDLNVPIPYPNLLKNTPNLGSRVLLDGDADKTAHIFCIPKTGTLYQIAIPIAAATANAANATVRVETVDASNGNPTGTLYVANGAGTFNVVTGNANGWVNANINNSTGVVVTEGNLVAVVFQRAAGSGNFQIAGSFGAESFVFPYTSSDLSAGSWTKSQNPPGVICNINNNWIAPKCYYATGNIQSANLTGDNDERGSNIRLPFKCRAMGMYIASRGAGGSANFTGRLYTNVASPALLATTALLDPEYQTQSGVPQWIFAMFAAPISLSADVDYALVVATSANGKFLPFCPVPSTYNNAFPGGINHYTVSRTGASGAFTANLNSWDPIVLAIDQIDDGYFGGIRDYTLRPWGNR